MPQIDGKVVKESRTKKKAKKKSKTTLNAKKFAHSMKKAANRAKEKGQSQCSKIVKAARKNQVEFFDDLSDKQLKRLKLNCLDEVGYSPLHHAARKGSIAFLKRLLNLGVDQEIGNSAANWTPLQEAAYWGQLKVVKILLNQGSNPNHITTKGQNTLHIAAQGRYGNEGKITKTLIQVGADVNQIDKKGWSPLFDAAENGCFDCVNELLQHGGQPSIKGDKGKTAKDIAGRLGFSEISQ